jgi:hypothetical protein
MKPGRVPKGYQRAEAYRRGDELVLIGEPSDGLEHSCDAMGCGSFDHVLWRGKVGLLAFLASEDGARCSACSERALPLVYRCINPGCAASFRGAPENALIAALKAIAKKSPHKVGRNEAADMACEFVLVARRALGLPEFPEAGGVA